MGPKSGVLLILLSLLALSQGEAKGADLKFRLSARAAGGATGPSPHGFRWLATRTETAGPTWWRSSLPGELSQSSAHRPWENGCGTQSPTFASATMWWRRPSAPSREMLPTSCSHWVATARCAWPSA